MAYLLGSKACMESLSNDVQDIQWVVNDIFSRTGPVVHTSWKFPDKMSCDLDIDDLMEMYEHSEDEEENQVAHIALYEMVIDRMVLLIQSMSKFTEQLMTSMKTGGDNSASSNSSAGLVVKKYWNRLVQLHTVVQQTQSENISKNRKFSDLEKTVSQLNDELTHYKNGQNIPYLQGLTSPGLTGLIPPNNTDLAVLRGESVNSGELDISKDEYNKSSQTIETVFVPCEYCHDVQKCFREAGEVIVNTCQSQNLPSCLKKFRSQVADIDWMSSNDIKRWTADQNKDVLRLSKHVEQLASTIAPLQEDVAGYMKDKRKMTEKVERAEKELRLERETQSAVKQQFAQKVEVLEKQHAESLGHVTREKEELQKTRTSLATMLAELKEQLSRQQQDLQKLETTKDSLEVEVEKNKVTSTDLGSLETEVNNLNTQLEDVKQKLEKSSQDLTKEHSKNKSIAKHGQSLQGKHDSLLHRVGDLDQENQDLRDQVGVLEDEKDVLETSLTEVKDQVKLTQEEIKKKEAVIERMDTEKRGLEVQIENTQTLIERMEKSLEEAKERERMIVEYPDLNGPVNPDYQGTGDIAADMENQVKANSVRIQVLENQNEGLRNSITKVLQMTRTTPQPDLAPARTRHIETTGPAPLWNQDSLHKFQDDHENHQYVHGSLKSSSSPAVHMSTPKTEDVVKGKTFTFDTSSTKVEGEVVVGRSTRPSNASKHSSKQGRPSSGKGNHGRVMAPINATSISAYIQMKKSGPIPQNSQRSAGSRPSSGKQGSYVSSVTVSRPDNSGYTPADVFVCINCDKMYNRERDLEIHKSYCTGS